MKNEYTVNVGEPRSNVIIEDKTAQDRFAGTSQLLLRDSNQLLTGLHCPVKSIFCLFSTVKAEKRSWDVLIPLL